MTAAVARPERQLASLATIPGLARTIGVPRRTLYRKLIVLHGRDRAAAEPGWVEWLFRYHAGPWRVNVERLRLAHPELFGCPPPDEMWEQIKETTRATNENTRRLGALAAAFREHRRRDHGL